MSAVFSATWFRSTPSKNGQVFRTLCLAAVISAALVIHSTNRSGSRPEESKTPVLIDWAIWLSRTSEAGVRRMPAAPSSSSACLMKSWWGAIVVGGEEQEDDDDLVESLYVVVVVLVTFCSITFLGYLFFLIRWCRVVTPRWCRRCTVIRPCLWT